MDHSPKLLLVEPEFPPSYRGFRYALELMGKRSSMPPLGLLTVAAMIPARFEVRLVDLNVTALTDLDLDWAHLAQERFPAFLRPDEAPDRIASYRGALARSADAVVVPIAGLPGGVGTSVRVSAARRADVLPRLPHVVCVACAPPRRRRRAHLIELGVALTGDAARAERAFERAFALA